ncbi:MAG: DMT family transporter [Firmicutes bacterium]|nr:DMT family transporter [Bacillota bacterium]
MNKKAILAGIAGNSIFGFSFLFSKIALQYVSPIVLLSIRFDIAFITLGILVLCKIVKVHYQNKDIKRLLMLGLLQPIVYFLCENNGLQYVSSAISGVLIAIIPIVTFFTGFFFLHEKFEMKQLWWAVVSLIGVSTISIVGQNDGSVKLIGILLLLGAVLSAAIYNTLSRQISNQFSPFERTFMMFFMGALFFTGMAVFQTRGEWIGIASSALEKKEFLFAVIYLGIVSSILAFYCLNYSVSYLPVRQATSFAGLTPIITVVAGVLVLHESINWIQIAGIVMILLGVYKVNQ